ncbi:MAG: hypothetical protein IKK87_08875, partial [Bacteroidaceae bacterium]|nr:hypothetical protein [Bacteroidaceae bacterium]
GELTEFTELTCRKMTDCDLRPKICTPSRQQMFPSWAAKTVGIQLPAKCPRLDVNVVRKNQRMANKNLRFLSPCTNFAEK